MDGADDHPNEVALSMAKEETHSRDGGCAWAIGLRSGAFWGGTGEVPAVVALLASQRDSRGEDVQCS